MTEPEPSRKALSHSLSHSSPLLDREQAQAYLAVKRTTLHRLVTGREIELVKLRGKNAYPKDSLDAYLAKVAGRPLSAAAPSANLEQQITAAVAAMRGVEAVADDVKATRLGVDDIGAKLDQLLAAQPGSTKVLKTDVGDITTAQIEPGGPCYLLAPLPIRVIEEGEAAPATPHIVAKKEGSCFVAYGRRILLQDMKSIGLQAHRIPAEPVDISLPWNRPEPPAPKVTDAAPGICATVAQLKTAAGAK